MSDGYPAEDQLARIEAWEVRKSSDAHELLEYVRHLWSYPDRFVRPERKVYRLSTGGWSGNESIVCSLQANLVFWALCWEESKRGGHYRFKVPDIKESIPDPSGEATNLGGKKR